MTEALAQRKCEEAGGIDLVVICNSGEQRPSNEPTTPETP
jgi:predicted TIM-barrel enzyme